MRNTSKWIAGILLAVAPGVLGAQEVRQDAAAPLYPVAALAKTPTLKSASAGEVRAQLFAALAELPADKRAAAEKAWPASDLKVTGFDLLERVALTVAATDDRAQALWNLCSQSRKQVLLPDNTWLVTDANLSPMVRNNLRLFYGRWLSKERYYEESLEYLVELAPEQVVDPATLLFSQGVAHHRLLHKKLGLDALNKLVDDVADAPARYRAMAMLLHHDLSELQDETLDVVARQMADIERRLELGRTGRKVIKIEDDVIAALDRMIKQLEDGDGDVGPPPPRRPTIEPRTRIPRGPGGGSTQGEGEVEDRKLHSREPWGDMNPKKREKALQDISKEFGSHYSDVIRSYFRKIATEGTANSPR